MADPPGERIEVVLSEDLLARADALVQDGRFASRDDVVREALDLFFETKRD